MIEIFLAKLIASKEKNNITKPIFKKINPDLELIERDGFSSIK